MARIRTIKPEFWDSPSTAKAGPWARLLYLAMFNWADDFGRGTANLKELEGFAFPNDDVFTDRSGNTVKFRDLVAEVIEAYDVLFYEVDNRPYFQIPSWEKHQRNERRAKASRYPEPVVNTGESPLVAETPCKLAVLPQSSGLGTGEQGNRGTGEQREGEQQNVVRSPRGSRIDPQWKPTQKTWEVIQSEFPTMNLEVEHQDFVDYWLAAPGQKGVKLDWDATWRRWMRKNGRSQQNPQPPTRVQGWLDLASEGARQ